MSKLFSLSNVKNSPSRSGFDLSFKHAFTAKTGELLPVAWQYVVPGDTFECGVSWFTRTQPVNTAAYTRVREYYDWFFVPMHLMWKSFDTVITQMYNNPVQASSLSDNLSLSEDFPYTSLDSIGDCIIRLSGLNNMFGFDRSDLAMKLVQLLRYGNVISISKNNVFGTSLTSTSTSDYTQSRLFNVNCGIFPLAAYQKIYSDFFRNSQWESAKPYLWNFDYSSGGLITFPYSGGTYYSGDTLFDLKYCNWHKDLFMGVFPSSQYGDVAVVNAPFQDVDIPVGGVPITSPSGFTQLLVSNSINQGSNTSSPLTAASGSQVVQGSKIFARLSSETQQLSTNFSILQLRAAECLQRYKELQLTGSQDYKAQVKKLFNVDVPDGLSNLCEYLGGQSENLMISEVVNTNLQSTESTVGSVEASIAGKGSSSGQGTAFKRQFNDYGVLMCIYHNVPLLDYVITGVDKQLLYTSSTDFPNPMFDRIGLESLPMVCFQNSSILNWSSTQFGFNVNSALGYVPRFFEFKTNPDRISGAFTTTLKDWVAPVSTNYIKTWISTLVSAPVVSTYQLFKVNPSILDSIFTVAATSKWDTDQFLINAQIEMKAVRPYDYDGMPF